MAKKTTSASQYSLHMPLHDHTNLDPTASNPIILLLLSLLLLRRHVVKSLLWLARVPTIEPAMLLTALVLHLLLTRVPTSRRLRIAVVRVPTHRVRALVVRLAVVLVLRLVMLLVVVRWHLRWALLMLLSACAWL